MATAKQFLPLRRVVVTGLGLVTPLANGVETTWQRLLDKKSGIRELRSEDLKLNGVEDAVRVETLKQLSSKVVATVPIGTGVADFNMEKYSHGKEKYVAPFIAYALCAAEEALSDANWQPEDEEAREKTGVAIGGGIGCINDVTQAAQLLIDKRVRRISPFFIPRILINMAAGHISIKYGFKGPNHAAVTACASGAHSVGDASRMIKFGDADVMVAGGTEASIDALSIAGFCRARALSTKYNDDPQKSSRPFDCGRDGFVIGEGAGVMVLEEYEHAKKRGARIYAELCGYGLSGDAVEAGAIKSVFKKHALSGNLSLSSTKGATGHLLGAAGAVEAIFTILALHHGEAPPTLNLDKPDPVFEEAFFPISCPRKMSVRAALTNSFGFGGTNASLLFASPS
ncbi:hypothetical protein O6H91_11G032400 [Diphasiastrum complanatum]|uniref:Uncharacterized protein n=1 Tax=Diphasiastrum complanatum TaxID=34168 RepID=A0ACC2C7J7_DIPCM|nr:hypothetical protein O6H91_11G032400 [Diphasiastrum complanatum]